MNLTIPFLPAYRVSSSARITFVPGRYLVPRWRMIIWPTIAFWPSLILTPRRFAMESRPNLVDPTALVCAIDSVNYCRVILCYNVGNVNNKQACFGYRDNWRRF